MIISEALPRPDSTGAKEDKPMGIEKEQFSAGEVAQVLRVDGSLLQNWVRRSNLEPVPSVGGRRLFSLKAAIELAILKELNLYGMGPVQAGDVIQRLCRKFALDSLTGKEVLYFWPRGGNSTEDVERSDYGYELRNDGIPFDGGEQSALELRICYLGNNVQRG